MLHQKVEQLRARISQMGRVLVAYSGGADSAYLLAVAADVLGDDAVALTASSASIPAEELESAVGLATELGARHEVIASYELDDPRYVANPSNRCYFCKNELYVRAAERAAELGISVVIDGTNADDLGDWRPGRQAASEHGVRSPLAEVGLTKEEIRSLSRELGLRTWDKPAAPCLASRIPYGTDVTDDRLKQIEAAERAVRAQGFEVFRVRYHGEVARIEIATEEMDRILDPQVRQAVIDGVKAAGFTFVAVDLAGFKSGSLNVLKEDE